jgi:integrase
MPILTKQPPKYRYHKGSNQAVVSISGKAVYLGVYGSPASHEKYQQLLSEWQTAKASPRDDRAEPKHEKSLLDSITPATLREKRRGGNAISINELMVVYQRYTHQYYRKNGKLTREAELIDEVLRFLRKKHGLDQVDDFRPVALDDLRDEMIDDLDWSRKHINKQVIRLIAMFKWAVGKELANPSVPLALKSLVGFKKGRTKARETKGVSCVEDAMIDLTLPKLPETVADMVRFQRLTGARPGEVCSLRPCDIDRQSDVWIYVPAEHKTEHHEKNRIIVIGPRAQKIILSYLVRPADSYCFSPAESEERRRRKAQQKRKTPNSCGNRRGSNRVANPKRKIACFYKVSSYRIAIRRVCNKLGIKVWFPNQLRHTAATEIRKEFGLEAAQVICGHQTADITQVYAERDLDLAKKVARAVG